MDRVIRELAQVFGVELSSSGREIRRSQQRRRYRCRRKIRRILVYVKIELRLFDERGRRIEIKGAKELLNMLENNGN